MAQKVTRIIHRIVYYACFVGMAVLLIMMLLTSFDVFGRSLFRIPIPGAFEIQQYMLAVVVLLGFGYAQQVGQHIRVDLFISKMPVRFGLALTAFYTLIGLMLLGLITWQGWVGGLNAIQFKSASDLLRIPSYPFEFLVAVGGLLFTLELLIKLIVTIGSIKRGIAVKEAPKEAAGLD